MKILQVLEAAEGGTRTHMKHILEGLCMEFDLHLVYSLSRNPGYGADIEQFRALGITCTEIPMCRNIAVFRDVAAVRKLRRLIRNWEPDIIHSHSSKAGFIGRRALSGISVKSVYTPHCLYFPSQKGVKRSLYRWGEKINEKYTDRFIAVSDEEKRNLASSITSEEKVIRIDNGVDLAQRAEKKEAKIVFAARAVRQKGWDLFLRVAAEVLAQETATFLFAGAGLDYERMKSAAVSLGIEKQVELPGTVENAASEYSDASVCAVTSRWEGQPYSVLEAMACGCPVVAFNIPGMDEIIEPGRTGELVKPFDVNAFAEKVIHLLRVPEAAESMGRRGRTEIEKRFTRERFVSDMRTFYRELVNGSGDGN